MKSGSIWINVVAALAGFAVLFAGGCATAPPPPKGGTATQALPPAQMATQELRQPDAPEGQSSQVMVDREVEHRTDGTVVIRERNATTTLGGSQDWAEIVREYARIELLRGALLGIALLIGAVVAWSKGWPTLGLVLGLGAAGSLLVAWWAGLIGLFGSGLLYFGWTASEAYVRKTLPPGMNP